MSTVFGTQVGWSTDGGLTWTSQDQGPGGVGNRGDPAAVIDLNDDFYVGYIDPSSGQGISISRDTGATWTHVTIASTVSFGALLDKNHLAVDNVATSAFAGQLYSAWTAFDSGSVNNNDIEISVSSDGGLTWSAPTNISNGVAAGSHNQGVNVQTGPAGEVYAAWSIYDGFPANETAIGFNSSTNGGATWAGESRILSNIMGIRITTLPNEGTRANSFPSMCVDVSSGANSGAIYIFWTNQGVPGINAGDADIYMIRSTDGGATWGTPIRVNDDATTNAQWFPWATCDPATGELFVIFYDRRDDPGDLLTIAYVARSSDGGATWTNFQVGDMNFTPKPVPGLASGYMGDYLGIAARDCRVYPLWSDDRTGFFTAYVSPFDTDTCDTPPSCDAGGPYVAECEGLTTSVSLDGTGSSDAEGSLSFLWEASGCPGAVFDDATSSTPVLTLDTLDLCPLECEVTLTVTDEGGQSVSCDTTVTIEDTTPPEITCPKNVELECVEDVPDCNPNLAEAVDACDPSPSLECLPDTDNGGSGCAGDPLVITRTYRATDMCGNSIECEQTITVEDDVPPEIECNAPETIVPPDAPISFTATAADFCEGDVTVEITEFDCFTFTKKGKRIDKTESCDVDVDGATITILDSGGVGDHITWTVKATDACGNEATKTCEVEVVNPGKKP